jgi:co-chaperonin GroES (HSP10)
MKNFDLTAKKKSDLRVESVSTPALGAAGTDVIIQPKGPRLKLEPIGVHLLVDMPNETEEEVVGGIHLPAGMRMRFDGFRPVKVIAVGPEVKQVKEGDAVLVTRAQVDQVVHDGHSYWRTTETAIVGVIRP